LIDYYNSELNDFKPRINSLLEFLECFLNHQPSWIQKWTVDRFIRINQGRNLLACCIHQSFLLLSYCWKWSINALFQCFSRYYRSGLHEFRTVCTLRHSVGLSELQESIEMGEYEWPISNCLTGLFLNLFEAKPKAVVNFALLRNNWDLRFLCIKE